MLALHHANTAVEHALILRVRVIGTAPVSMLTVQVVLRAAERAGLDVADLLREAGPGLSRARDMHDPVPPTKETVLWRAIQAIASDEAFGIRAAMGLGRGELRGLEYAIRASDSVGEGLRLLDRFGRLLHRERVYEVRHERDGSATLSYDGDSDATDVVAADFGLASIVVLLRDATGADLAPRRVLLRRREPSDPAPHRNLFRSPIEFGGTENALELDAAALATPMREADPALRAVLEEYLNLELQALDPVRSLADAVRTAIVRALPEQEADLDTVAAAVGLSPRVLQKRLQQSGTSFQEVLDQVRESLAKRYLLQPVNSLSGTALSLGYSDVTAFHRAFKRWTGLTPGDYRRRALRESADLEEPPGDPPRTAVRPRGRV